MPTKPNDPNPYLFLYRVYHQLGHTITDGWVGHDYRAIKGGTIEVCYGFGDPPLLKLEFRGKHGYRAAVHMRPAYARELSVLLTTAANQCNHYTMLWKEKRNEC